MGPTIQIKNKAVSLPICNNMHVLPDCAVWITTARGRTLAWACPPESTSDMRSDVFLMQAAAYGFGEWAWEAMRSDQPESFRSVCTLRACGHISQCMKPGSMKSLWHFLMLFKFSLTMFSQTKFVILSELPALLLYVQSSSFTLQFAMTFGIHNSDTGLKKKMKCKVQPGPWKGGCWNESFQQMSFQLWVLQGVAKSEKDGWFFSSLVANTTSAGHSESTRLISHIPSYFHPTEGFYRHFRLGLIAWFASLAVPWCFTWRSIQKKMS